MIPAGAPVLTAHAMRDAEARVFATGVSQDELMERAGAVVARETARFAAGRPILVLAGPGNNGGDAYVAARLLKAQGHDVAVVASGPPGPGAAERMHARWDGPTSALYAARPRPVLVDGLFGTGLSRPLERGLAAVFADLVAKASFTLAIDVPSGIETDSGADLGVPRGIGATLALGALKPAHLLEAGLERCGHVLLADIGIPIESSWRSVARPRLTAPGPFDHKYTRGLVAVVEGAMPGAARLAARAAMAGGAGYVVLAGTAPERGGPDALVRRTVETAADLAEFAGWDRIDALLLGPGLGRDARARNWLEIALHSERPLILDGDAISLLAAMPDGVGLLRERGAPVWLTPHSGEFDRLFPGDGGKIARTVAAAADASATIVHKGADTVIAAPRGTVRMLAGASPWLSTAGTGDVLAGLVAAQVARGAKPLAAAETAAWLHARAAALAGPAFIADRLADLIPEAIAECL